MQLFLAEYYVTPERCRIVFDVIFCSDLLLQIPPALAIVFHLKKKTDSCCTLGEELELLVYEQFMLVLRRLWLKNLHLYLASSDFSIIQNLKGQQGNQNSKQNYHYQNSNI